MAGTLKDTTHLGNHKVFRHAKSRHIQQTPEDLLLQQLGVAKSADYPLAALLYAAEQNQPPLAAGKLTQASPLWLVQPVHMALQRDTFSLQAIVTLTEHEYQTLTDLLNDHFKADGYTFLLSQQQQYWFLHTQQALLASSHSAQAVLNQNVQLFQPAGEHAKTLRQIMNAAQMLLHEHAINQARVAHQTALVNSIWLSGGGALPTMLSSRVDALLGCSTLVKGVSAASKLPRYADIATALASPATQAVLHAEAISDIDWDAVYAAVKRNKIKLLDIYMPIGNGSLHLQLTPFAGLRFWRKAHTLESHMQTIYGQH